MVEDKITKIGNMTIRYKIRQIITLTGGIFLIKFVIECCRNGKIQDKHAMSLNTIF